MEGCRVRTTRITLTPIEGSVLGKTRVTVELLTEGQVPGYLFDTLAAMNLSSVVFNWSDGTRVEYTAWEFDCLQCGSYEHKSDDCPEANHDEP